MASAKESIDVSKLLPKRGKRGVEGDVDFLREARQVLLESIMDAEVGLSKKSAIVPTSADRPSIPR